MKKLPPQEPKYDSIEHHHSPARTINSDRPHVSITQEVQAVTQNAEHNWTVQNASDEVTQTEIS